MERITCAKKIAAYIKENQISIEQTARDTAVPREKLDGTSAENLSASEFLDLCDYLGIRPEEMR
ncbi:MAG: hypothetical protein ACI4HI_06020 [Lachnospiraceae bacterium]